jgi:hypothetical protein
VIGIMPVTYRIAADTADELAEPLRKIAKQVDGKFVVDALPEGFALEDVKGLKSTVQKLRGEAEEAKALAKTFAEAGLTAEEAKTAAEALGKMKAGQLKSTADLDAWKQGVEAKYGDERKKVEDKLSKREKQLRKQLIDNAATSALVKSGGGNSLRVLLPLVRNTADVIETSDGELRVVLKDESGRTIMSKKSDDHGDMTIEEYVGTLREAADLKSLFVIPQAGGSGSTSQAAGSGTAGNQDSSKLSARERIQRANEKAAAGAGSR